MVASRRPLSAVLLPLVTGDLVCATPFEGVGPTSFDHRDDFELFTMKTFVECMVKSLPAARSGDQILSFVRLHRASRVVLQGARPLPARLPAQGRGGYHAPPVAAV